MSKCDTVKLSAIVGFAREELPLSDTIHEGDEASGTSTFPDCTIFSSGVLI